MGVDDRLNAVQESRDPLDLVDENGSGGRGRGAELALQPLGLCNELAKRGEACQVQGHVRFQRAKERGLPGLAWAQQQDIVAVVLQPIRQATFIHVGKI